MNSILDLQIAVMQKLNSFIGTYPLFDKIIFAFISIDVLQYGIFIFLICWLWFRKGESQRTAREKLCITIFFCWLILLFNREITHILPFVLRPIYDPSYQLVIPPSYTINYLHQWNSIISDHATLAFSLATGIFSVSKKNGIVAFLWAIFGVCFPRVYFGIHRPSDILIGLILGIGVISFFIYLKSSRKFISNPVLKWENWHPSSFYAFGYFVNYFLLERFDQIFLFFNRILYHFGLVLIPK